MCVAIFVELALRVTPLRNPFANLTKTGVEARLQATPNTVESDTKMTKICTGHKNSNFEQPPLFIKKMLNKARIKFENTQLLIKNSEEIS